VLAEKGKSQQIRRKTAEKSPGLTTEITEKARRAQRRLRTRPTLRDAQRAAPEKRKITARATRGVVFGTRSDRAGAVAAALKTAALHLNLVRTAATSEVHALVYFYLRFLLL
jgi:hypothetical protein